MRAQPDPRPEAEAASEAAEKTLEDGPLTAAAAAATGQTGKSVQPGVALRTQSMSSSSYHCCKDAWMHEQWGLRPDLETYLYIDLGI